MSSRGTSYIFDKFCGMYWNPITRTWQNKMTKDCLMKGKDIVDDMDLMGWHDDEDIVVRPYLQMALAA